MDATADEVHNGYNLNVFTKICVFPYGIVPVDGFAQLLALRAPAGTLSVSVHCFSSS
jgi:hypothetical protein